MKAAASSRSHQLLWGLAFVAFHLALSGGTLDGAWELFEPGTKTRVRGASIRVWTFDNGGVVWSRGPSRSEDGTFRIGAVGASRVVVIGAAKAAYYPTFCLLPRQWRQSFLDGRSKYREKIHTLPGDELVKSLLDDTPRTRSDRVVLHRIAGFGKYPSILPELRQKWNLAGDLRQIALSLVLGGGKDDLEFVLRMPTSERLTGTFSRENLVVGALVEPESPDQWSLLEHALKGDFGEDAKESSRIVLSLNGSEKARSMLAGLKTGDRDPDANAGPGHIQHGDLYTCIVTACMSAKSGTIALDNAFQASLYVENSDRALVECDYLQLGEHLVSMKVWLTFRKVSGKWHLKSRHCVGNIVT